MTIGRRVARPAAVLSIALLAVRAAIAGAHPAPPPARIVNGTPTTGDPAIGMLFNGGLLCTATLIGCSTVLTAAHCICAPGALTAAQCRRAGLPDPAAVFFVSQYALAAPAREITIHPDFNFARGGDVAVVKLAAPLTGIAPLSINRAAKPAPGSAGTIVGFGRTGGNPDLFPALGIKRSAPITTTRCPGPSGGQQGIPGENHLCIDVLDGNDAGTCQGDSGGPLLIDGAVAGIASGGASDKAVFDCLPDSLSFFADTFRYRTFINSERGDDDGPCGDLPAAGGAGTQVHSAAASVSANAPPFETTLSVPAGAQRLRVVMNGDIFSTEGLNNFDLFVNPGSPATPLNHLCASTNSIAYGACDIANPQPGTWYVTVDPVTGAGALQVTMTVFGLDASCGGDCNGDGRVGIDELVRAVTIGLGDDLQQCPAVDTDGDGVARIAELIAAVSSALGGCSE